MRARAVYTSKPEYNDEYTPDRVFSERAVTTYSRHAIIRHKKRGRELIPLADDDASAAARGRHVVVIGVATRSSTYVANQRCSPAGHPRTWIRQFSPYSSIPPTQPVVTFTLRAGCCCCYSRGILRIPSLPLREPPSVAARRPENQAGASTPLLPDRLRYAPRHSRRAARASTIMKNFGDTGVSLREAPNKHRFRLIRSMSVYHVIVCVKRDSEFWRIRDVGNGTPLDHSTLVSLRYLHTRWKRARCKH